MHRWLTPSDFHLESLSAAVLSPWIIQNSNGSLWLSSSGFVVIPSWYRFRFVMEQSKIAIFFFFFIIEEIFWVFRKHGCSKGFCEALDINMYLKNGSVTIWSCFYSFYKNNLNLYEDNECFDQNNLGSGNLKCFIRRYWISN